jgi:hypothetical protein
MRYMPTLRSPVSGSLVTTQGSVMKRPPSSGQHFRIAWPAIVGRSTNNAFPPFACFISRLANSVISSSVASGSWIRFNSPA